MKNIEYRKERIEVTGIVQGVGFRPFIYKYAVENKLNGYVLNNPNGVTIEVEGAAESVERFIYSVSHHAPPLAQIIGITRQILKKYSQTNDSQHHSPHFEIRESVYNGTPRTLIPPDICVCEDCLREFFNPNDRRYLYPFINCTNCGPRFTIIHGLPYDRPYTTMSAFTMCPECLKEYNNPDNRRFHAQPNACPVCGPRVKLVDRTGTPIPGDPLLTTIKLLKNGNIIAVKGLGGFHLACDGTNNDAVVRLRQKKHREEKPFALMTGSIDHALHITDLGTQEIHLLKSRERPIVLAPWKDNSPIAPAVAPDNPYLGIMLPYTPLHYSLFFHPEAGGVYNSKPLFSGLVMTSGNLSEEPICKTNDESLVRLSGIADAFLIHNRDIHVRCDDSVMTIMGGEASSLRRSRGYVPVPLYLKKKIPSILALGGELKNTLCITEGFHAFMSQHIGDMENIATLDLFREAVNHFTNILDLKPDFYAYDLHPTYLSTQYFTAIENEMDEESYGAVGVQHHHAHIASVMAEHGYEEPVIGFSCDGTGFGLDGTIWGGEVLLCTAASMSRLAHLTCLPLPGGESAIRMPWRMAFSYLRNAYGDRWRHLNLPCLQQVSQSHLEVLERACMSEVNTPLTSSLGRLFDAVSSLLNTCHTTTFEGQGAFMLEMIASHETNGEVLPYAITEHEPDSIDHYPILKGKLKTVILPNQPHVNIKFALDYTPLIHALVDRIQKGLPQSKLARDFHTTLLVSFMDIAEKLRDLTGINTIVLSGGCWQNRILNEEFSHMLAEKEYTILKNRLVPTNDGGLSLGQAYIAGSIVNLIERYS